MDFHEDSELVWQQEPYWMYCCPFYVRAHVQFSPFCSPPQQLNRKIFTSYSSRQCVCQSPHQTPPTRTLYYFCVMMTSLIAQHSHLLPLHYERSQKSHPYYLDRTSHHKHVKTPLYEKWSMKIFSRHGFEGCHLQHSAWTGAWNFCKPSTAIEIYEMITSDIGYSIWRTFFRGLKNFSYQNFAYSVNFMPFQRAVDISL